MLSALLNTFKQKKLRASREDVRSMARRVAIRAKYDAAQTNADNSNHWAQADSLSADSSNSATVRATVRNRSRYEVANNSYARGIVNSIADITIGTGPRLQMLTEHDGTNNEIEAEWQQWASEVRLAEKLRTHRMARAQDGEAFSYFTTNPKIRHAVKLDLRQIEADQVTDPEFKAISGEVDGISFDTYGNPEEYLVLRYHPGAQEFHPVDEFDRIRASMMIHSFRVVRPGQHRGIPELTAALPLFAQLRRYTLAVLAAAESAANQALVLQSDGSANDDDTAPDPMDEIELARNMMTTLPSGWKLGQVKAEQPVTTYAEFKKEILGEIARCLSIPKSIALGDSTGLNYSSGRLDHQAFFRAIEVDRSFIELHELDRIFDAWLFEYQLARASFRHIPVGRLPKHSWFWDGLLHVDPEKEAKAQNIRLLNGMTTYATEYSRAGADWQVQMTQRAKEEEFKKERGLVFVADAVNEPEPENDQGDNDDG